MFGTWGTQLASAAVWCADEVIPATEPALSAGLLPEKAPDSLEEEGKACLEGSKPVGFVMIKLVQSVGFVAWSSSAVAIPKHSLTCLKRV